MHMARLVLVLALAVSTADALRLVRPLAPAQPRILNLRGGGEPSMGLAKVAAAANLATFSLYGAALILQPGALMKGVMRSDGLTNVQFGDVPFALAQYLGAMYLSQALRCLRALTTAAVMKEHLLGVGIVQLFLCVTSMARLAMGIDKNAVTLSLPVGQGVMAALCFAGAGGV